jgi:hypothetical protein
MEATMRVEVMRKGGGGGERSEAEMASKGRDVGVDDLRGKETERRGRSLRVGLGFLRGRRGEEGTVERTLTMLKSCF